MTNKKSFRLSPSLKFNVFLLLKKRAYKRDFIVHMVGAEKETVKFAMTYKMKILLRII